MSRDTAKQSLFWDVINNNDNDNDDNDNDNNNKKAGWNRETKEKSSS